MAQPDQNAKVTLESVLKLVEQLDPTDQEQLGQTLNRLQALRQSVDVGVHQPDNDQDISVDKVFHPLLARHEAALLSEQALAVDWLNPEEDKAWSHLSLAE